MTIAATVENYLKQNQAPFEVVTHPHTRSSLKTANMAHIPSERLAKAVMLEDEAGYLMAVVPATYHVNLGALRHQLGRNVGLATESDVGRLFKDCELGAIPPLGPAYGIETVFDESLTQQPDIYFEAGDHEELIHMSRDLFVKLLGMAKHGRFCQLN